MKMMIIKMRQGNFVNIYVIIVTIIAFRSSELSHGCVIYEKGTLKYTDTHAHVH